MAGERESFMAYGSQPQPPQHARWAQQRAANAHDWRGGEYQEVPMADLDRGPPRLAHPLTARSDSSTASASQQASFNTSSPGNKLRNESHGIPRVIRRKRLLFFQFWWLEILACVFFVAALLGLFAVLYSYTNKPSPDWPTWLSLNTIVAIYITLLKTGVLLVCAEGLAQLKWLWFSTADRPLEDFVGFDNATRGPLGAAKLLWRLKLHHLLSSCGAVLVMLSLVADPFAQQIIRYESCSIQVRNTTSLPTMPRTNYYWEIGGDTGAGAHIGAGTETISQGLTKSIVAGVFSPVGPPTVHCSTGNCTWPGEYSTVGYCSSCVDISHQLVFSQKSVKTGENLTEHEYVVSIPGGALSISSVPTYTVGTQNFSVMGPAVFGTKPAGDWDFLTTQQSGLQYHMFNSSTYPPSNPYTGEGVQGCNSPGKATTWSCQGYGAARCSLDPCVKTFTAKMIAGEVVEKLIGEHMAWQPPNFDRDGYVGDFVPAARTIDTSCLSAQDRRDLADAGANLTLGERWQPFHIPLIGDDDRLRGALTKRLMDEGCVYMVNAFFLNSLGITLAPLFTGTVSRVDSFYSYGPQGGLQSVQAFSNFGDASLESTTALFQKISTSMTNYIRSNGYNMSYSRPAYGIAHETKTCVTVRWGFLTFPSALVLLTMVFFIFMLAETRALRHNWKSSPLPLLYRGFAEREAGPQGEEVGSQVLGDDVRTMENMARTTIVRLDREETGSTRFELKGFVRRRPSVVHTSWNRQS